MPVSRVMNTGNIIAAVICVILCVENIHAHRIEPMSVTVQKPSPITSNTSQSTGLLASVTQKSSVASTRASRGHVFHNNTEEISNITFEETSQAKIRTSHTKMQTTRTLFTELQATMTAGTEMTLATSLKANVSPSSTGNCMNNREHEFRGCVEQYDRNAMKYIFHRNLSGFIDNICDINKSKPYMECMSRHFRECPQFLDNPKVRVSQFGAFHIKDIVFFTSIDQMCSCVNGVICISELLNVKHQTALSIPTMDMPWTKMPNLKALCDINTSRYIGCVRGYLPQCQSPLTNLYAKQFTTEDAEELKRMYHFTKEHCEKVKKDAFDQSYRCFEDKSRSETFRECVKDTDSSTSSEKLCKTRECVDDKIKGECDSSLVPLYIDAVNIYLDAEHRLLKHPCSCAGEISISVLSILISMCMISLF